jgi:3-deoxy-D-manno-octulosonic-acid transferase
LFLVLAAPVVPFYALLRVFRNRSYASTLAERFGFLPARFRCASSGALWIHAVSVGEVITALPLIRKWRAESSGPVFVSSATLAGYGAAQDRLTGLVDGCFYAPLDYVWIIRRVLRTIQPSLLIVFETEIWPNLFREVKRADSALLISNGRISDRAFPSYRRNCWFFEPVLAQPDRILVQNEQMRDRYLALGAPPDRIEVAGNLKFDFEPRPPDPNSPVLRWLDSHRGPVLIAASTTEDESTNEDAAVLDAFKQMNGWRLIIAPRKPDRFDSVASLIAQRGFPYWRRTEGAFRDSDRILLLDTIGELSSLFDLATVVFMGGTLTATSGHNFLEPAFSGKPVIVGPRLENFRDLADLFLSQRALLPVGSAAELPQAIQSAAAKTEVGQVAKRLAQANRGAAARTLSIARELYQNSLFHRPKHLLALVFLSPFAWLWTVGSRVRLRRQEKARRKLATRVISVGNLTAGGTGKTPVVLHLARSFEAAGLKPAILTRGHGRTSHHKQLILDRGELAGAWHTGDEPQIFLRAKVAPVGIGWDRAAVGAALEARFHPDVFLLDDGFSHRRLARDFDLVLIDSLAPFGRFAPIPLGRLREPLSAMARANAFLVTRWEPWRPVGGLEREIRKYNPHAPIFYARQVPREWIHFRNGAPAEITGRAIAFCGLGNPESFWRSLAQLGMTPLDRLVFSDHHRYSPHDLERIAQHAQAVGATCLLTTEKDIVNLCDGCDLILKRVELFWLRLDVEIQNEDALLHLLTPAGIRSRGA